jgi:hypothetical protein
MFWMYHCECKQSVCFGWCSDCKWTHQIHTNHDSGIDCQILLFWVVADHISWSFDILDKGAYNKAVSHMAFKQVNTWVIKIKYMSDTAFFRLENMIKEALQSDHVIHIPILNQFKILVLRQTFHSKRNDIKVNLAKWIQHLDSEDVRECGSLPEVTYIRKDDYSDDESSFFSNSIRTIMSFEYDDTTNLTIILRIILRPPPQIYLQVYHCLPIK